MLMLRAAARTSSTSFSTSPGAAAAAAALPMGVVVSLLTDSASWMPHRDLHDAMGLKNNFLCHGEVSNLLATYKDWFVAGVCAGAVDVGNACFE